MLSLKELNKAIDKARDADNIKLIHDVMSSFHGFEKAIMDAAAAGERSGVYSFVLPKSWAEKSIHGAQELVEKELHAHYAPILITVVQDTIGVGKLAPYIGVEFIIPGEKNMKPEEYGYQMKERAGE